MRRLSVFALSILAACEPPTPEVNVDIVLEPPMEIDTFMGDCVDGQEVTVEPYWSEEMCARISVPIDDWYIEARQVSLDFDDYCVEYLIQNENGVIDTYCNGMQLHLDADEHATVPLRAVAFEQKRQAFEQFGGLDLVVKATLTMYATNRWNNEQIETVADYDILMANYDNCAGVTPSCAGEVPAEGE
jgi:hypothetical protein